MVASISTDVGWDKIHTYVADMYKISCIIDSHSTCVAAGDVITKVTNVYSVRL